MEYANFFMDDTHQKETYKFMDVPQLSLRQKSTKISSCHFVFFVPLEPWIISLGRWSDFRQFFGPVFVKWSIYNRRADGSNAAVRSSILKGKTQRLVT